MDDKLVEEIKQKNIVSILPPSVGDFKLRETFQLISENGADREFVIFSYFNDTNSWSVRGVFNPQSEEYSVRTDIVLLEFSLIEFITDDLDSYCQLVETRLPRLIHDYYVERSRNFSKLLLDKGITTAPWSTILPAEHNGFRCLIRPDEAVRIINGSYMIVAYYHEDLKCGISIMYNVLRDDFFAEKRIHGIPSLVHDFDGHDLKTLLHQMERHFLPILDTLSQEAGI